MVELVCTADHTSGGIQHASQLVSRHSALPYHSHYDDDDDDVQWFNVHLKADCKPS